MPSDDLTSLTEYFLAFAADEKGTQAQALFDVLVQVMGLPE